MIKSLEPLERLAFANWRIGKRKRTRYITLHYNGPRVPGAGKPNAERDQLRFDALYHMRRDTLNADGIQYHIAILSDGMALGLRPLDDMLWHCGNALGNAESIAIHVPIGDMQYPTPPQAQTLTRVFADLRSAYGVHAVNVKPHSEWKRTLCPGTPLATLLRAYRVVTMAGTAFQMFITTDNANVRKAADYTSPVAYVMPSGTIFAAARVVENGKPLNGNAAYVQLSDDSGFIHLSIARSM